LRRAAAAAAATPSQLPALAAPPAAAGPTAAEAAQAAAAAAAAAAVVAAAVTVAALKATMLRIQDYWRTDAGWEPAPAAEEDEMPVEAAPAAGQERSLTAPGIDEWLKRKMDAKAIMRQDHRAARTARVHVVC
jgi:hypothetical protein